MRAAPGAGRLDGGGVLRGAASHPVCGDELAVELRVVDGAVVDYRWQASGCPATLAVPAAAASIWSGCPVGELEMRLRDRLGQLGGLASHEGHAVKALMRAVHAALESDG